MGGSGLAAVAAAILAVQSGSDAPPCAIDYAADSRIDELVRDRGFAFETYDRLCAALRQHGLELVMVGGSGVLSERAYGWASLSARRAATRMKSEFDYNSISLDTVATDSMATDALYEAINNAANSMAGDVAEIVRSIEQEEARLRTGLAAGRRENERR